MGLRRSPRTSVPRPAPACYKKRRRPYENTSVRRLGYLLERTGHARQASALESFAKKAKSTVRLDPSIKPLVATLDKPHESDPKWKLILNEIVEVDF